VNIGRKSLIAIVESNHVRVGGRGRGEAKVKLWAGNVDSDDKSSYS